MGYITCSINYLNQIRINYKEIYLQYLSEICSIFAENGASERSKFCSSNHLAPRYDWGDPEMIRAMEKMFVKRFVGYTNKALPMSSVHKLIYIG